MVAIPCLASSCGNSGTTLNIKGKIKNTDIKIGITQITSLNLSDSKTKQAIVKQIGTFNPSLKASDLSRITVTNSTGALNYTNPVNINLSINENTKKDSLTITAVIGFNNPEKETLGANDLASSFVSAAKVNNQTRIYSGYERNNIGYLNYSTDNFKTTKNLNFYSDAAMKTKVTVTTAYTDYQFNHANGNFVITGVSRQSSAKGFIAISNDGTNFVLYKVGNIFGGEITIANGNFFVYGPEGFYTVTSENFKNLSMPTNYSGFLDVDFVKYFDNKYFVSVNTQTAEDTPERSIYYSSTLNKDISQWTKIEQFNTNYTYDMTVFKGKYFVTTAKPGTFITSTYESSDLTTWQKIPNLTKIRYFQSTSNELLFLPEDGSDKTFWTSDGATVKELSPLVAGQGQHIYGDALISTLHIYNTSKNSNDLIALTDSGLFIAYNFTTFANVKWNFVNNYEGVKPAGSGTSRGGAFTMSQIAFNDNYMYVFGYLGLFNTWL